MLNRWRRIPFTYSVSAF